MSFVAVDFDGTIVEHEFPAIGPPVPGALDALRWIQDCHKLILYTMRSGDTLDQAIAWLKEHGIEPWSVNDNPTQRHWTDSRKVFAHLYIDDAAAGCPLLPGIVGDREMVDWEALGLQEVLK